MSDTPLFSVVIPTYNHGAYIRKCLESLKAQTCPDWEAIVVNNYSEDDTLAVVESVGDSRIRVVNFRNNGVIAASRNEGIRQSRGQFVAFLDSDDWWYPQKLATVLPMLDAADVVYHDLDIHTPQGKRPFRRTRTRQVGRPVFADLMINANTLPQSSVVVRRELLLQVGGVSEARELIAVEDFDLWLRIAQMTDNFVRVPRSLGAYWIGTQNVTEVSERQIDRVTAVFDKHAHALSDSERHQAKLLLDYTVGRIKLRMGKNEDARQLFRRCVRMRNLSYRLKSWMWLLATHYR